MLSRLIPFVTVAFLYASNAQATPSVQANASKTTRLCLNAKTGAIIPRIKCKSGESLFTAKTYLKEVQTVSDNVDSLATTVNSIPLPNLLISVAPSGTLIKTISDALAVAKAVPPSSSTPVLIKLAPGTYSLPTDGITLPSFVTLEGSGIGTTILQVNGGGGVRLGDSSRLANLSLTSTPSVPCLVVGTSLNEGTGWVHDVEVSGQSSVAESSGIVGIRASSGTLQLDRVRVRLSNSAGFATGVISGGASTTLRASQLDIETTGKRPQGMLLYYNSDSRVIDSQIAARSTATDDVGNAIRVDHASTKAILKNCSITNTTATGNNEALYVTVTTNLILDSCRIKSTPGLAGAGFGVINASDGGQVKVFNSTIETDVTSTSAGAFGANSSVQIANSVLAGGPITQSASGTVLCAGVTDENFIFFSAPCPN